MGGKTQKRVDAGGSAGPVGAPSGPVELAGQPYGNMAWVEDLFGVSAEKVPVLAELGSEILATFGPAVRPQPQAPSLSTPAADADSDVALARSQLAGRFTILSPADAKKRSPKNRSPNEITAEEFERVARQFSGIRRGAGDLKFAAAEGQAFKDGTMNDIAALLQTASGRRLVAGLTNNVDEKTRSVHHQTELRPPRDGAARTVPQEKRGDNAVRNAGDRTVPTPGTDMRVEYVPGKAVPGNGLETGTTIRSDVTLFHELTHALRGTLGRQHGTSQAEEEYETVGFHHHELAPSNPLRGLDENAYRAERAKIGQGSIGVVEGDRGMARRTAYSGVAETPQAKRR